MDGEDTRKMETDELIGSLINHLSCVAHNLVFDFSSRFDKRQDYLPVEELAAEIQKAVVVEGFDFWKRHTL